MKLSEQFEKQTGGKWFVAPVCHGDRAFCSDNYMLWLEQELVSQQLLTAECINSANNVSVEIDTYKKLSREMYELLKDISASCENLIVLKIVLKEDERIQSVIHEMEGMK